MCRRRSPPSLAAVARRRRSPPSLAAIARRLEGCRHRFGRVEAGGGAADAVLRPLSGFPLAARSRALRQRVPPSRREGQSEC